MNVALIEARAALGSTAPNPAVGAVVVKDGEIIGRGHTQPHGEDRSAGRCPRPARARRAPGHRPIGVSGSPAMKAFTFFSAFS